MYPKEVDSDTVLTLFIKVLMILNFILCSIYHYIFIYTRNLVDEGNGKYNLLLLCWSGGQKTGIHDHAGSHCFVKAIKAGSESRTFSLNGQLAYDLAIRTESNGSSVLFSTHSSCNLKVPGVISGEVVHAYC
ncbi:unnamed protein product [Trichobilharzia regenti]|nr:unnamed protein product [Trichobilharzia regenti]